MPRTRNDDGTHIPVNIPIEPTQVQQSPYYATRTTGKAVEVVSFSSPTAMQKHIAELLLSGGYSYCDEIAHGNDLWHYYVAANRYDRFHVNRPPTNFVDTDHRTYNDD